MQQLELSSQTCEDALLQKALVVDGWEGVGGHRFAHRTLGPSFD